MDHLPNITIAVQSHPDVPYLEDSRFTYKGPIESFEERCKQRHPCVASADSSTAHSSFVQNWLYFGTLTEFFRLWEFELRYSDFTLVKDGKQTITNRLLPDYLVAYFAREHREDQSLLRDKRPGNLVATYTGEERRKAESRMDRGLKLFQFVHDSLSGYVDRGLEGTVDAKIWDSIILLVSHLARFWEATYGSLRPESASALTPRFSNFEFRSIPDFRKGDGFCQHEKRLLSDLVDHRPNDIAFLSRLDRNEHGVSHESCLPNECKAYQVNPDEPYHTVHADDCEGECEFIGLEEEELQRLNAVESQDVEDQEKSRVQSLWEALSSNYTKEAFAIIFEDGKLTPVSVHLMKSKIAGQIRSNVGNWTMVAFSHVWADGLGNPGSNRLPFCQLRRLQGLANEVYGNPENNVPFWIDTLLIPVIKKDEDEPLKTNALRNMEWVYKYASKVLVLDKRLFGLESRSMEAEEIGARIMCSSWSRRLWTLQEGCSKRRTYFKFKDQWVHWPSLHEQVLDRGSLSNWSKSSKLPKKHPLKKAQKVDWFRDKKGEMNASLSGNAGNALTSPMISAWTSTNKRFYKVVSPCWHSIYRFLEEMTIDWSGGSMEDKALARCIRGMYYRNCSKISDEPLVLASMLSKTPGSAAKLTEKSKEERYKTLFESLKEVPEDLLFLDQERYDNPGKHWIPRSLLSVQAAAYRPPTRTDELPKAPFLSPRWHRRRFMTMCEQDERGISLGLRGLKLLPSPRVLQTPFRFLWEDRCYKVGLKHPGTKSFEETEALPEAEYVLILERVTGYTDDWVKCNAALVRVKKWHNKYWSTGAETDFIRLGLVVRMTAKEYENSKLAKVEVEEPTGKFRNKIRPLGPRQDPVQTWVVG